MKHTVKIGLASLVLVGCGVNGIDDYAGTWSADRGGTTLTCDDGGTSIAAPASGTLLITRGDGSDLLATRSTDGCALAYDLVDGIAQARPGQTCASLEVDGGVSRLTFAASSIALSGDGQAITVEYFGSGVSGGDVAAQSCAETTAEGAKRSGGP